MEYVRRNSRYESLIFLGLFKNTLAKDHCSEGEAIFRRLQKALDIE